MGDWFIFDSETVTLRPPREEVFPGSGSPAAVKVHKELSVGSGYMTGFHFNFNPAKDHESPHLTIDERMGLVIDLGYVSLARILACENTPSNL
ncbi:MAG: hypothetical protein QNJ97_10805 [Myxococcota bacterium]|nr:hypothetical protein [Myxococcota bacterium]